MSLISAGSISLDSTGTFKWDCGVRNNALPASVTDPDSKPDWIRIHKGKSDKKKMKRKKNMELSV